MAVMCAPRLPLVPSCAWHLGDLRSVSGQAGRMADCAVRPWLARGTHALCRMQPPSRDPRLRLPPIGAPLAEPMSVEEVATLVANNLRLAALPRIKGVPRSRDPAKRVHGPSLAGHHQHRLTDLQRAACAEAVSRSIGAQPSTSQPAVGEAALTPDVMKHAHQLRQRGGAGGGRGALR